MTFLDSLEPRLPQSLRPALGLLAMLPCWYVWTNSGSWCRKMNGRREPYEYRLGVAMAIWRVRYFVGRGK
jgi:hypothetical protein